PVVAQVTGLLGLDQLVLGTAGQQAVGAATGGGGGLLNLAGGAANLLGGGGLLSGFASGLGGILSGGGLSASFATLGGLATGSAGLSAGAFGAALPALGIVIGAAALLKKAFSRKYNGEGFDGSFSADGFTGRKFTHYKGGWFRSDKWVYDSVDAEIEAALDEAMQAQVAGLKDMAKTLGLSTKGVGKVKGDHFAIWANGKSQEQIEEEFARQMGIVSDEMSELILKGHDVALAGETATETLSRLASGLLTANDAMDLLGRTAFEASVNGGHMASDLVASFGSAEQMQAATSAYFAAFYSEAEQADTLRRRALKQLSEQFDELGVAMPETRAGFRELVESIDLTSESGRELYAELLQLSAGMDLVLPKVAVFTAEMQAMVGSIGGEIGTQIDAARDLARISEQSANLWYRTAATLRDFLSDLLNTDLTSASAGQVQRVNQSRFETAFDLARGGDVEAARDIPALAKAYLESAKANASSSLEYRRIAAQVQGQVDFLAGVADLEGANDDVLRGLYEKQIDVLTNLSSFLQLEGLTADQVADLGDGIQELTENWDGTLEAFESSLGALEDAINNAEAFSYDDLVGQLDVAVSLADDAPRWVQKLVDNAETGLRTTLDFVIRNDELSPADKWIATNAMSEHVAALDFVLRNDLDKKTKRLVLETTTDLHRNLSLNLIRDLDPDTREMLLARNANLTRRVNVALEGDSGKTIRKLKRISDLIGTDGSGKITFDGGIALTSDEAFKGLSEGVQELVSALNKLRGMMGELRDAVEADRIQRENVQKIAGLQVKGADAVIRSQQAQGVVDEFNALREQYGITLVGQKGTISVNDAGRIETSFDYYGGGDVVGFKKALRDEFGTEFMGNFFSSTNRKIGNAEARAEELRSQIRDLGGIPAFARGTNYAPGGSALVGEEGPEIIDLPRGARVHPYTQSRNMLDNGEVVRELRELRKEVAATRSEQRQLGLQTAANTKKTASNTRTMAQDALSAGSSA
ncbi:MAG: hypothetical protein AB3N24_23175, partial [Leisingera sp.]